MQSKRLYQLFDVVVGAVEGPILPMMNDAAATRMFFDVLGNPQTTPGQHPKDFQLLCVGVQYEDGSMDDGSDGNVTFPHVVTTGLQWVANIQREIALEASKPEVIK